jgi:DNA-binding NtrC family response regulator
MTLDTPRRVLFVEDDAALRRAWTRRATRVPDLALLTRATVADARAALAEEAFDLVICDYHLVGETTADLVRELAGAGQAVVVLTGEGTEARAALTGCPVPIFDKPMDLGAVLRRLGAPIPP